MLLWVKRDISNDKSFHQEDIKMLNLYAVNNWIPQYRKQQLEELGGETDNSILIIENFNTHLSVMDRKTRQNINNDIEDLKKTINQLNLIYLCGTSSKVAEYIFISNAHGIVFRLHLIIVYKASLIAF